MEYSTFRRAASTVGLATLLAVQPASTLYPEVPAQKSKCPTTFRSPRGDASVSVECFLDYDLSEGLPNGELHEFMVVRSTGLPDHWRPSDSAAVSQSWETTIPLGAVPRVWPAGGDPLPAGLVGYALNGVPFFSSAAPLADLATDAALQHDRCMGFVDPASGAYHYRTMPPCLFGGSDRAAYDQHSMVEGYAAAVVPGGGLPSPLIGYMIDGFPLFGPYDADGQLHAGLDSCNGKMVNGSYAYFATASFPYIMGCYGPGAVDDTASGVLPSARSEVVLDVTECPAGMYQDLATSRCVVCPAGTFGREAGLASAACSGLCPPGAWCPPGSSTPVAQKCAAGRYGSAAGLSTAACSGPCSAGYYCPEGSTSAEQVPCGGIQWFCPEGSGDRVLVTEGYYTITVDNEGNGVGGGGGAPGGKASGTAALPHGHGRILTGLQGHAAYESASGAAHHALPSGVADAAARDLDLLRRTKEAERHRGWQIISEPGTYSHRGLKRDCPAGRYGNVPGLKSADCTAACSPGHFCPKGSALPTACPKGTYGATEGLGDAKCSGQATLGHYTPTASTSATEVVCPAGRYGDSLGLTTDACSHDCDAASGFCEDSVCKEGYYCPPASVSKAQAECGGSAFFCPKGSALPTPVATGYYTVGSLSKPGEYQTDDDVNIRYDQVICEPGTYCIDGVRIPCPAGRFGGESGLSHHTCSGPAEAGYYTPIESVSARQVDCGGTFNYCPEGSPEPVPVGVGNYSVDGPAANRAWTMTCEPGFYCAAGVKRMCPAGRYGKPHPTPPHGSLTHRAPYAYPTDPPRDLFTGLRVEEDLHTHWHTAPAEAGKTDHSHSHPHSHEHDEDSLYLEHKSHAQSHYHGEEHHDEHTHNPHHHPTYTTRDARTLPPWDWPTGTYIGLSSEECSGPCKAGYYCPAGSTWHRGGQDTYTRRTSDKYTFAEVKDGGGGLPCPAGRWGGEGMTTDKCEGLCAAGYFCPVGSISPTQTSCGAETLYCPPGSGEPLNVTKGYYATGGTVTTRTGQAECLAQTAPDGARLEEICPSTTVGEGGLLGPDRWYDGMYDPFEYTRSVNEDGAEAQYGGGQSLPADPSQTEGSASMN